MKQVERRKQTAEIMWCSSMASEATGGGAHPREERKASKKSERRKDETTPNVVETSGRRGVARLQERTEMKKGVACRSQRKPQQQQACVRTKRGWQSPAAHQEYQLVMVVVCRGGSFTRREKTEARRSRPVKKQGAKQGRKGVQEVPTARGGGRPRVLCREFRTRAPPAQYEEGPLRGVA